MNRLSSPISALKDRYDIIVIGSGYGGSITALRMALTGKKVCLLEKGREYQTGDFPKTFEASSALTQIDTADFHLGKKNSLFDVRVNPQVNVVQGCGLGGTSLINANVGMEPDPSVFNDPVWPGLLRNDRKGLDDGYAKAKAMLRPVPYPGNKPMPAKAQSMKMAADGLDLGDKWKYTDVYVNFDIDGPNDVGVEQKPCIACGECCSGCNYEAKNTTVMNYLPAAKTHGAEIYTQINVRYVEKQGKAWLVHFNYFETGDEPFDAPTRFISADIVVLAAGTLGSTELLLRSAQNGLPVSTLTGRHFSGNGDFLAFAYNNDPRANSIGIGTRTVDPADPIGANITSIIDLRNEADPDSGMVIEEGVVPGFMAHAFKDLISIAAPLEGKDTAPGAMEKIKKVERALDSDFRGPYHGATNHTLTFLVLTHDNDHGQLLLENDRLRIEWPGAGQQPIFEKVNQKLLGLTTILKGVYTRNPIWTKLFGHELVTVHPLGGCIMGEDADSGVVNHKGQVFTGKDVGAVYEGLYISDGSIVPRTLGINPSFTISALAERNCACMAADRGWTISPLHP